jgi:uncharacterized NAD-dependent epimerase/dehydratase family protein
MREIPQPYLLFLGDTTCESDAKTAFGLRQWSPERCLAEWKLPAATVRTGLPTLTPAQARARGARSLVIGVAPIGGAIAPSWIPALREALEAGLDIVSGMHARLESVPELAETAAKVGRQLINIRTPPQKISVGTGRKRTGKRLLTVGTDCALGKKYTALTIAHEFVKRGVAADFRATGQTGILIAGAGIPIDSIVADFVAGAAELLSPDAAEGHWDVVEGQGSIFHPAYAGVSLGLLHGTQPDVIVMCHEPGRDRVAGMEHFATPNLSEAIAVTLLLARRTNPHVRCAGIALNTARLDPTQAHVAIESTRAKLGLPVADPIRGGLALRQLVDACFEAGTQH